MSFIGLPRRPTRRATLAFALVPLLLGVTGAQAQTARDIIKRHTKALGDARALKRVTSLRLSGTAGDGAFTWWTQAPNSYAFEIRRAGGSVIEGFDGRTAWRSDPDGGARTLTGIEQRRARATGAYRNGRWLTLSKDKVRVRLLGRETVEGRAAHAVELTAAPGVRRKVLFDAQTYLIVKEEQECESGKEEFLFGDYRAVDGVLEPHRIRMRRGSETLELVVQEAEHNVRPAPAVFAFPSGGGAPLPDVASLLEQVLRNQNALQAAQKDYTYTKTSTETRADGEGEKVSQYTYEAFSAYGRRVEKLVAKNGRPLTPEEARNEDARVAKQVRENERRAASRAAEREGEDEDDRLTVARILRVCRFVNPRRERWRGRDAVVVDFEARPGGQAADRLESALRKLVGSVWIDEDAKQLLRLEARVNEPIKIGAGLLLSLQRGASLAFEQEFVNDEVWLPSYAEVIGSARLLLVKGIKINQVQRFSDYRKFEVETSSQIKAPVQ